MKLVLLWVTILLSITLLTLYLFYSREEKFSKIMYFPDLEKMSPEEILKLTKEQKMDLMSGKVTIDQYNTLSPEQQTALKKVMGMDSDPEILHCGMY